MPQNMSTQFVYDPKVCTRVVRATPSSSEDSEKIKNSYSVTLNVYATKVCLRDVSTSPLPSETSVSGTLTTSQPCELLFLSNLKCQCDDIKNQTLNSDVERIERYNLEW